ncbi:MAG: hypothetical protein WCO16_03760 [bacterium]
MKPLKAKIEEKKKKTEKYSSGLSKFFRLASPEEKKRVFLKVAKEAIEEQKKVIEAAKLAR